MRVPSARTELVRLLQDRHCLCRGTGRVQRHGTDIGVTRVVRRQLVRSAQQVERPAIIVPAHQQHRMHTGHRHCRDLDRRPLLREGVLGEPSANGDGNERDDPNDRHTPRTPCRGVRKSPLLGEIIHVQSPLASCLPALSSPVFCVRVCHTPLEPESPCEDRAFHVDVEAQIAVACLIVKIEAAIT